jgi:hypothetical protein
MFACTSCLKSCSPSMGHGHSVDLVSKGPIVFGPMRVVKGWICCNLKRSPNEEIKSSSDGFLKEGPMPRSPLRTRLQSY